MTYYAQPAPAYGTPVYQVEQVYAQPPPVYVQQPAMSVTYQANGNCPSCQQGFMSSNMTALGICLAIFFFPIGLVCLFLLQEQRCSRCGYTTG